MGERATSCGEREGVMERVVIDGDLSREIGSTERWGGGCG